MGGADMGDVVQIMVLTPPCSLRMTDGWCDCGVDTRFTTLVRDAADEDDAGLTNASSVSADVDTMCDVESACDVGGE